MRLTRVHVPQPLVSGAEITLPEGAAAHLTRVLRLGVGDACIVFNGDGQDYAATLVAAGKRDARLRIGEATRVDRESPLRITLLQGVAKGEKMDLILQKATELGVHAILPVWSQRSDVKLDGERAAKRLDHWRNVVVSGCEQCGRAVVPEVAPPLSLAAALAALEPHAMRLLLDPEGTHSLRSMTLDDAASICIAVGPEGGWSPLDREQLHAARFDGLRLGPRILRTETAGLSAISALQARFGDLV
ncbi:16S rRNA (uracil(1498)-N(3))-methyltransferase [Lysobacter sp. TY2-98]|uniref:16S rRNA (uracil(1498)-N(3))-methyltransferase n=1 Tax=Lysobacter sp. TY2-98 TaxID=2290922 RepID=UPI000E20C72B|nr:16S rRNA (uracil(1498)-N(3))-methyltransferase [Lysobacter sp. TY2-98]AXK71089.1 16S rRNA (uracil(1498)-N(3))-methyltransferase [Lysobacter sp. TY2-98]